MLNWSCKKFNELSPYELYAILQLRNEVFVVEQNCIFQDADNKDQSSFHLTGWHNQLLVAYTRIVPPGLTYEQASIGRVVIAQNARRNGMGKLLMQKSIEELYRLFGKVPIRIGAQLYLKQFYESLKFQQRSDVYIEDGIEHIEMILP